ncbi:16S rRNA (guanine(527)-N(7))-methyltransferase RsmG [Candidatus Magnetomonas plexicatena]|uniref:16S rRNA (guanine(527)-N(7))-methyltransferase RsmG n=1 Tax=Candidatus Magnetomonas plexicatena TaxID=2552947 RepID=UPI001C76B81E|nr:16S rRNA (guanine(527)-N(7))-methyltransferase RsmG [Nitrospirales bacterium LBB_01]
MKNEKERKMSAEAALIEGLRALSIKPSETVVTQFMTYLKELKKWSDVHNLTAIKEDSDIVTKHFLDSLLFLKGIPDEAKTLLDVGSGAGFPGIPIKIVCPELEVTLMEPRKKRAVFLRHMIHLLKLTNTDVYEGRLEDMKIADKISPFDCIVIRAALSFSDFTRLALPLIGTDSVLVIGKGKGYESEIQNSDSYKIDIIHSKIPLTDTDRFVLLIKSTNTM